MNKGSYLSIARKHKIGNNDQKQVFKWVRVFNEFGDEGLKRSRKNDTYFVSTVGGAPLAVIKQYIENQKTSQRK